MEKALEKFFHLEERGTNVRTELIAGATTFVTAAYILAVNPSILSETGMPQGAVFTATVLISFIGTLLMAALTNYPFILCPGMGINAYFTYTVCLSMGYSWQTALTAIFVEGIIFVILSLTNVREAIFNAIPMNLKLAITSGVGLFITIIGLKGSGLVVPSPSTLVTIFSVHSSFANGTFATAGITAILALVGIIVTAILVCRNVRGNILLGILITWALGIVCQLAGVYVPNPACCPTSRTASPSPRSSRSPSSSTSPTSQASASSRWCSPSSSPTSSTPSARSSARPPRPTCWTRRASFPT